MQDYKSLNVWVKAHLFTLEVYAATKSFPKEETYGITNQLRKAASSIPANTAKGCGKNTQNELAYFLNIGLGSANESEYFLILARDLNYLATEKFQILFGLINEVKGMLISLINKVRK